MKNNLQVSMQKNHADFVDGKISKMKYESKREALYTEMKLQKPKGK